MFEITENINYFASFFAGILSFFSPCILPLIPAYFSLITGYSIETLTDSQKSFSVRKKIFVTTIFYVLGFSFVFVLLGSSASFIVGKILFKYKAIIRNIGGIIIIIFALHLLGLLKIGFLQKDMRFHSSKKAMHPLGAFLIGMAFAAGWTPCIGPILGTILIIAGNQASTMKGIFLLLCYSAGLSLPFILISIFINFLIRFIRKAKKIVSVINIISGIFLLIMGVLLILNKLYLF